MTTKSPWFAVLPFLIQSVFAGAQESTPKETGTAELSESLLLRPAILVQGNRIKPLHGPIMPTFLAPEIVLEEAKVSDLRYTEEAGYTGNLCLRGKAISLAVYQLKSGPKQFHDGYLYVNGEIPIGSRIEVGPLANRTAETISSYTPFDTTIESISLTEGNNFIELVFRDPITGLEGGPGFSVEVEFQEGGGPLPDPQITLFKTERDSQSTLFTFMTNGPAGLSERERFVTIHGSDLQTEFKVSRFPNSKGGYLVAKEAPNRPVFFALIPSQKPFSSSRFRTLADLIGRSPDSPRFTDREMFLTGLSYGWFSQGGDLITSSGEVITDAVSFDLNKGGLTIIFNEAGGDSEVDKVSVLLPGGFLEDHMTPDMVGDFAELMWQAAHLYRTDDPRKDEVPLGMLLSDYSSFGSEIKLSGWTSEFLIKTANLVEGVNEELAKEKSLVHGFYLGSSFAVAAQIDLPRPGYAKADEIWRRPLMSEVLTHTSNSLGSASADLSRANKDSSRMIEDEPAVSVPEEYQSIWPWVTWYYESTDLSSSSDDPKFGDLIPESIKHPLVSPGIAVVAMLCVFGGSIWLLVVQFSTSLGWGFGQLGANVASCLLFLPGLIVAIVFCCLYWPVARRPFALQLAGFILVAASFLFIPEWVQE